MKGMLLLVLLTVSVCCNADFNFYTINCLKFCAKMESIIYSTDTPDNVNEFTLVESFPTFVVTLHVSCVCTDSDDERVSFIIICSQ